MWATPGAVLGPNGSVYVASGNGAELHGTWDHSDSVIELDPVTMREKSVFAPSTWREDNVDDLDLGSMAPAVVPAAGRIVIAGKRGVVYLLGPSSHGVGSELASLDGCQAFGGSAVVGRTVLMPCLGEGSVRALRVSGSSLRWGWSAPHLFGAPVVAGSRVYVADRDSGDLVVLSLASGRVLSRQHAGPMPHFPSQVVSGRWVFVPSLDGVTAFRG
jgi:outer membrane protein assembly factor BamB